MRKILLLLFGLFLSGNIFAAKSILLATTTSTDNTGLLNYLAPRFKHDTGIELKWVAVGTGKALELGKNRDVDVLLVHAPAAEKKYMAQGYGINRKQVMYNYFVIIGPASDPAKIKGKNAVKALAKIATNKATFISRGDDSGTNKRELQLWHKAELKPPAKSKWYLQSGQGMLATIRIAENKRAYTLTDTGTYIKYAAKYKNKPPLVVLVHNLRNQYSVIVVKRGLAQQFSNWLVAKKTQRAIAAYKLLGQRLFTPDAIR